MSKSKVCLDNSPDDFDGHCKWLLKKIREYEDGEKKWDKNSRKRMNYFFRKETAKNTRLLIGLSESVFGKKKSEAC